MSEHDEQKALIDFCRFHATEFPALGRIYAIPNGGHRHIRVAQALKDEGVRAGVLDLCLPVPRVPWGGMYIEMKFGRNKLTPEQEAEMESLRKDGYFVPEPCYSWVEAAKSIAWYLNLPQRIRDELKQAEGKSEKKPIRKKR